MNFFRPVYIVITDAVAIEDNVDRGVEAADFAKVFEAMVHLLVGHIRKGYSVPDVIVFVFVQNRLRFFVKDDGEAVVSFLGGDSHDAIADIGATDFDDIAVAERCEREETEEIPGFFHGDGFHECFLVLATVHISEFNDGALSRDFGVIKCLKFVSV